MKNPNYLIKYKDAYQKNPRAANLEWFKNAGYGLFIHYGLFSILGNESDESEKIMEWVQYNRKIPVMEYSRLIDRFTAKDFDARFIASFAKECGMKYINLTTRHHESFCLFETKQTDFNSLQSPAKRDLVKELVEACEEFELGLFLYYSHGRDWRHPHAPNNDEWEGAARPEYEVAEPTYKYANEHDLDIYVEFMYKQVEELLTQYPTVAGIWLDGIGVPMSGDYTKFKCQELYDLIKAKSPHAITSYKQGLLGTEDFFAPEHEIPKENSISIEAHQRRQNRRGRISENPEKIIEVCTTMIKNPVSWGYKAKATHLTVEEVWNKLIDARKTDYNLLLNIGLLPDGAIDPIDADVLKQVGLRIKESNL
jgi:alpha-L-fucosidase